MFDFFKKRIIAKGSKPVRHSIPQKELVDKTKEVIKLANKITNQRSEKQTELARAASFAGQEKAALAFILQSEYADARLQAVLHIHSQEALLEVSRAMRNTDRRVCKLAQEKLTKLQNQQKLDLAVQACLKQGEQLLALMPVMANQVATWDKQRLALGEHGLALLQTKVELETRLEAQLDLQRQVLQVIGKLRLIEASNLSLDQAQIQFTACQQEWQEIQSSTLLASLPKNQLQQLTDELAKAQSHIEQLVLIGLAPIQETVELREEENKDRETKQKQEAVHTKSIDVEPVLVTLEQALQEGSLQRALEIDKSLRKEAMPTGSAIAERYAALRVELNRLLDWAKWGGNISREELINVADSLLQSKLTAPEIAKQVGGLRSRWKELDRTSGVAAQSLWERFNSACEAAYNIVDAHFKQQAQLRLSNLGVAQAQLAAIDEVILTMQNQSPDWKAHQAYINKVKQEWRKIGPIDRKLKAQLETEFQQKIATLLQPLIAAREVAIGVRHQLIEAVKAIVATERDAVEKVQQAQHRWQQEALNLPLEQKDEKNCWRQFRAACDAVFAQRKAKVEEQHQRRNQLMLAKQEFCEEVERSLEKTNAEIVQVLRKAKQKWRDLSTVKHKSDELDARFNAALKQLEQRHSELNQEEKKIALDNLRAKINLCRQIEATKEENAVWPTEWKSLESKLLPLELNKLLTQRFNNALARTNNVDACAQVEELLLRIELLRGMTSPPELAQQRLQLQVNELKLALKNCDTNSNYLNNFYALCAIPGNMNAQQEQRFQLILDDFLINK
jgi:hypothetical protein